MKYYKSAKKWYENASREAEIKKMSCPGMCPSPGPHPWCLGMRAPRAEVADQEGFAPRSVPPKKQNPLHALKILI